jgi:MFS transporter, OFA family, oxalate/formate antiporter
VGTASRWTRWGQLAAGILGMVAVANFQYSWTFFVVPLQAAFHWEKEPIQWAFSLFVLTETWLVPLEAYVADRWGPRRVLALGAVLVTVAWVTNAFAGYLFSLLHAHAAGNPWADAFTGAPYLFYATSIVGGTGAGMVYGTCIGSALKWFPDRRGLAAGLTAAGFGAGSALTVLPIRHTIDHAGFEAAFLWFGLGQGAVVLLSALLLRFPRSGELPAPAGPQLATTGREYAPLQVLRTPLFWLLYVMMTLVSAGGLMLVAQVDPFSADMGVRTVPLSLGLVTMQALSLATMLERILGGVTRPICGWISDKVGRETTMFGAFLVEGAALLLLGLFARNPTLFVLLTGLTFFAWGEIFSLFPAIVGDSFGRRYATTNYGLMYTAKGTASLLVPLASYLRAQTGSWVPVFATAAVFSWLTALLALFVLRPLRKRWECAGSIQVKGDGAGTQVG